MSKDPLGDRMKVYEELENDRRFIPMLPIMIRIDGICFSTFTENLMRPYDPNLSRLMKDITQFLIKKTNAIIGYTQSDEISLILYSDNYDSQVFFDGRVKKLDSSLAGWAAGYFNRYLHKYLPKKALEEEVPTFDCKSWQVPNKEEAANSLLWRSLDAERNSISMVAQSVYPHSELQNVSSQDLLRMIDKKGFGWNSFPEFFRYGTFFQKKEIEQTHQYTPEELHALPKFHHAKKTGVLTYKRNVIQEIKISPFRKVTNRAGVIFDREKPIFEN